MAIHGAGGVDQGVWNEGQGRYDMISHMVLYA